MVHENDAPRDARAGRIARGRGGGHFSQRAWRCALWARDLRAPRLTSAEKNLLLILALREHPKTGGSFASIATLSGDTGLNRQTVIKAAQGLERHGLLTRTHRARQPVLYRVTPPPGVLEEREIPGSTGAPIESEIPNSIGSPCNTKIGQMEYENWTDGIRDTGHKEGTEEVTEEKECATAHLSTRTSTAAPACPHQEIIALYHELLPELQGVMVERWDGQRSRDLAMRWRESAKHQELAFWRWFFGQVRKRRFYLGENERGWRADLGWLVKRRNFDKILEQAVSAQRRRVAAAGDAEPEPTRHGSDQDRVV